MSEGGNLTTAEGLEAMQAELDALEGEGRKAIAERIKTAREWGDLKENSEYHDAKNDQSHLETRILRLRERISGAVVVEPDAGGAADGVVGFGSTVAVRSDDGREHSWKIVGATDAKPSEGRLSVESPMAAALMGRCAGDPVTVKLPSGERQLTIVSVG